MRYRPAGWLRLQQRVGRRGASLLFFSLVDLVYAASMAGAPASTASSGSYAFLSTILPLWAWAIPWALVGLACLFYAFRPGDRPAFVVSSWLLVGWGSLHLAGFLVGESPRGYVSAATWFGFAAFAQVIATWREHEPARGP